MNPNDNQARQDLARRLREWEFLYPHSVAALLASRPHPRRWQPRPPAKQWAAWPWLAASPNGPAGDEQSLSPLPYPYPYTSLMHSWT